MRWTHARGVLELTDRPLLMGILNVTPDSFSDGGSFTDPARAVEHGLRLLHEGAGILDIGGESTRPGADPVDARTELARTLPVIEGILNARPDALLSIDTYKGEVARQAVAAGAAIINDVSGARWDDEMEKVIAATDAGYILMHAKDRPQIMQRVADYDDVCTEVETFLLERISFLAQEGVDPGRIACDVGIGFGKKPEHNLALLQDVGRWSSLHRPVVWGFSRKSFISHLLGSGPDERFAGGLGICAWLLARPHPQIWRIHDVAETNQFVTMWQACRGEHAS
jgi:dihydropteroate synthase